jgi:hypothetical protein
MTQWPSLEFWRGIAGLDPANLQNVVLESERTDPIWAQILPPASQWRIRIDKEIMIVATTSLSFIGGSFQFGAQPVDVLPTQVQVKQPQDSSKCQFQVYALVTRAVKDAFGRQNQEAFQSLVQLKDLTTLPAGTSVRLLEIQFRGTIPDTIDALIVQLFGARDNAMPQDATARIVRVSFPIAGQ